jgi:hypothetical protein
VHGPYEGHVCVFQSYRARHVTVCEAPILAAHVRRAGQIGSTSGSSPGAPVHVRAQDGSDHKSNPGRPRPPCWPDQLTIWLKSWRCRPPSSPGWFRSQIKSWQPRPPSCPGLIDSLKQVPVTTTAVRPRTASLLIPVLAAHVEPDVPLHH